MNGLNPEQREAVEALDGPVLLLAGAGTGKTRALTTRLAHILNTERARPWEILSVTFTNKAAREMRARVGELIGEAVEGLPWLGTFHSIAAQILRRHAELVDLKPSFTILDTDDQIRLIKQILQAENIDEKRWTPRYFASLVDGWKNRGLTPDRVSEEDAYAFANDGKRETHIFSHHVVSYKDRASGAEGSAEVCGLFKCGTDLIFECNEMTTVTRGAMGADLGSATA